MNYDLDLVEIENVWTGELKWCNNLYFTTN